MTFGGYCSNAELAKFLDFGNWREYPIDAYISGTTIILPTVSDDNNLTYIIDGTVSITLNGAIVDPADYSVDLETGAVVFDTEPKDGDSIVIIYYVMRGLSNEDLSYYNLMGARLLEKEVNAFYREVEVTYTTDGNQGLDYINYINSNTIKLPYAVTSVTELTVDGTTVDPSTLKIIGNNVSLSKESEVREFSGKADSVSIEVIHGILEPGSGEDYTEEEKRLLDIAKEANKCVSAMLIIDSLIGQNTALDNSYIVQRSDGSVRPDLTVTNELQRLEKKYTMLTSFLKSTTSHLL